MSDVRCGDCGRTAAEFSFCPMTGKPHQVVCAQCGLTTPYCPATGKPHVPQSSVAAVGESEGPAPTSQNDVEITDEEMQALEDLGFGIFAPGNPVMQRLEAESDTKAMLRQRKGEASEVRARMSNGTSSDAPTTVIAPTRPSTWRRDLFRFAVIVLFLAMWNGRKIVSIIYPPDVDDAARLA